MNGTGERTDSASGTALATAFMRALAAADTRFHLRRGDDLAKIFLPDDQRKLIEAPETRLWVLQNKVASGAYAFMIARTAFFDEAVQQALKDGLPQIVILGAGYDSRAYRFENLIRETRFFELDMESTQARKQDHLRQAGVQVHEQVRFVPIDLGTDDLAEKLLEAGYRREQKALFIWEGVTYYLTADTVNTVLSAISGNCASGSTLCFDYAAISNEALEEKGARELRQLMRSQHADEPAKFGIAEGELETVLGRKALVVREHFTAVEMQRRYLPGISPGEIGAIPRLFCLVRADKR